MKVSITGATGFIGRYFLHAMVADGHEVRVLARPGREGAVDLIGGMEGWKASGLATALEEAPACPSTRVKA